MRLRGPTVVDVRHLPSREDAESEASVWLARLGADDATEEDRSRFADWLRASPAHGKAYDALCGTWHELEKCGPLVRAVYFGQAMIAASAPRPRRWRWGVAAAAAASLAAVAFVALWGLRQQDDSTFEAAVGEQTTVALPDGSTLKLNSNSRAHVEYTPDARVVYLDRGEAFFSVVHNVGRPFWVHADNSWVRDVGTAFNVYLAPSGVVVTVSEGAVKVVRSASDELPPTDLATSSSAASVSAGEQLKVHGRAEALRDLDEAQLARLLAWRGGSLDFEDQPLGDVADELMRYTNLKIEFSDPALRQLRVGGTFRTSPEGAEALLTLLHDGFGMTVRRDGPDRVYIEEPARQR
jgi:transmembrane sensor